MKRLIQAVMVILLGVLLGMAQGQTAPSDAGSEAKQQEPVTLTWFVAEEGYVKSWNPQENVADAKILRNTGVNLEVKSGDLTDLDALIATDSLPDLITVEAEVAERYMLEN